jgi:hypothetical protein
MADITFDPPQSLPRTGYGDRFYLAASFSNLEAAGRAYTLIEQLLRRETDTDLSVYRFELSGLAFVVVLGPSASPSTTLRRGGASGHEHHQGVPEPGRSGDPAR